MRIFSKEIKKAMQRENINKIIKNNKKKNIKGYIYVFYIYIYICV